MKTVIWKLILLPHINEYQMPVKSELLHVAFQHGVPHIWFRCCPDSPKETRYLMFTGTGIPIDGGEYKFIGTLLTDDQNFVFHVFEVMQ